MSAYKFHGSGHELVPWYATYSFPTQSTKVMKQTVKLTPKNGATFGTVSAGGNRIRIEFPADSYVNMLNSVLSFDLAVSSATDDASRFSGDGTGVTVGALGTRTFTLTNTANQIGAANQLWSTFNNARSQGADFFKHWFIRILDGRAAGKCVRVGGSAYTAPGGVDTYAFTLEEDLLHLYDPAVDDRWELVPGTRLQQGGAHNLFSRLRVLYGSLVLEDIQYYSTNARMLFEMGVQDQYLGGIGAVMDGSHDVRSSSGYANMTNEKGSIGSGSTALHLSAENQGIDQLHDSWALQYASVPANASSYSAVAQPRTFTLNLFSGLLSQQKLMPVKWMAAQLAIELELNQPYNAFITGGSADLQYAMTNVSYITELMEFDSTYDASFYQELQMGVPLKYNSWDAFVQTVTSNQITAQIQERARSVKFMLGVIKDMDANTLYTDSDMFYHALGEEIGTTGTKTKYLTALGTTPLGEFQWRIGGRYFPAQPVNCANGAAEAYSELLKVTDYLGDYTKDIAIDMYSFSSRYLGGGHKFIVAMAAENNDAFPNQISGINSEEQSDIMLSIKGQAGRGSAIAGNKHLFVFVSFDALMIVKAGNIVELIK